MAQTHLNYSPQSVRHLKKMKRFLELNEADDEFIEENPDVGHRASQSEPQKDDTNVWLNRIRSFVSPVASTSKSRLSTKNNSAHIVNSDNLPIPEHEDLPNLETGELDLSQPDISEFLKDKPKPFNKSKQRSTSYGKSSGRVRRRVFSPGLDDALPDPSVQSTFESGPECNRQSTPKPFTSKNELPELVQASSRIPNLYTTSFDKVTGDSKEDLLKCFSEFKFNVQSKSSTSDMNQLKASMSGLNQSKASTSSMDMLPELIDISNDAPDLDIKQNLVNSFSGFWFDRKSSPSNNFTEVITIGEDSDEDFSPQDSMDKVLICDTHSSVTKSLNQLKIEMQNKDCVKSTLQLPITRSSENIFDLKASKNDTHSSETSTSHMPKIEDVYDCDSTCSTIFLSESDSDNEVSVPDVGDFKDSKDSIPDVSVSYSADHSSSNCVLSEVTRCEDSRLRNAVPDAKVSDNPIIQSPSPKTDSVQKLERVPDSKITDANIPTKLERSDSPGDASTTRSQVWKIAEGLDNDSTCSTVFLDEDDDESMEADNDTALDGCIYAQSCPIDPFTNDSTNSIFGNYPSDHDYSAQGTAMNELVLFDTNKSSRAFGNLTPEALRIMSECAVPFAGNSTVCGYLEDVQPSSLQISRPTLESDRPILVNLNIPWKVFIQEEFLKSDKDAAELKVFQFLECAAPEKSSALYETYLLNLFSLLSPSSFPDSFIETLIKFLTQYKLRTSYKIYTCLIEMLKCRKALTSHVEVWDLITQTMETLLQSVESDEGIDERQILLLRYAVSIISFTLEKKAIIPRLFNFEKTLAWAIFYNNDKLTKLASWYGKILELKSNLHPRKSSSQSHKLTDLLQGLQSLTTIAITVRKNPYETATIICKELCKNYSKLQTIESQVVFFQNFLCGYYVRYLFSTELLEEKFCFRDSRPGSYPMDCKILVTHYLSQIGISYHPSQELLFVITAVLYDFCISFTEELHLPLHERSKKNQELRCDDLASLALISFQMKQLEKTIKICNEEMATDPLSLKLLKDLCLLSNIVALKP